VDSGNPKRTMSTGFDNLLTNSGSASPDSLPLLEHEEVEYSSRTYTAAMQRAITYLSPSWKLSTIILSFLCVLLLLRDVGYSVARSHARSYESGFASELGAFPFILFESYF